MSSDNFYKRLKEDRDKLKYLSFINIDTSEYNSRFKILEEDIKKKEKETNEKYTSPLLELMIENLYKNALMRLRMIECEFINYNKYLDTCLLIEKITNAVNSGNIDKNELNDLTNNIINILESNYNFDKETLNNLYSICFKLMQLEIDYNSNSKILLYSNDNKPLRYYLKNRLENEILMSEKVSPSECNIAKKCTSSLGDKIINEENICEVTNDNIKNEVMDELKDFLRQINKNNQKIENLTKNKGKHNPITVSIVTYASILAVAASVVGLSCKNSISYEYLTDKTTITSGKITVDEKYIPKIKHGYQELVLETYPWNDLGNGTSVKKEVSYDVTGSEINKDNYEEADLSKYKKTISERKASDRIYNMNIGEDVKRSFVTLKQNSSEKKVRFDGLTFYIYMFLGSLSGIFTLLLAGSIYEAVTGEYIKDLTRETYRRIKNGEVSQEEIVTCENYSKKYLKLMEENEEIKKRFIEKYNKYCEIIDLDELKNEYNRIMK